MNSSHDSDYLTENQLARLDAAKEATAMLRPSVPIGKPTAWEICALADYIILGKYAGSDHEEERET